MTDYTVTETVPEGVPARPADEENEALIDALKTFQLTVITTILFVASAVFFIMRTRMG